MPYVRAGSLTVIFGEYRLKPGVRPMALGRLGTVGWLKRFEAVGAWRITVLRPVLGLAVATRLGRPAVLPNRVGRLGVEADEEVLRLGLAAAPAVAFSLLPPERPKGRGFNWDLPTFPLILTLFGFERFGLLCFLTILRPLSFLSSESSPLLFVGFSPSVLSGVADLLTCWRVNGFSPGLESGGVGTSGR